MGDPLSNILATTEAEQLATGFAFTEGPTWHPDGFYYFVDLPNQRLHRLTPGQAPETVRETPAKATARRSTCKAACSCAKAATAASAAWLPTARSRRSSSAMRAAA